MQPRRDAGEQLAQYADREDVIVLGLPRGGVPVAFEVAETLAAPLDVFVARCCQRAARAQSGGDRGRRTDGAAYRDFSQTRNQEVQELLERANA